MEHIDHVAARVSTLTFMGLLGGATGAVLMGYPKRATALKVASSCALVATTLFGSERIAYLAMQQAIPESLENRLVLTSHAFSGVFGGALNGYLYQMKPIRGMVFFTPVMIGIGFLELEWTKRKKARLSEILNEEMQQDQDKAN